MVDGGIWDSLLASWCLHFKVRNNELVWWSSHRLERSAVQISAKHIIFSLINFLFHSLSPWMPDFLLNDGCKVLLRSTQSVINGGHKRGVGITDLFNGRKEKERISRALRYSMLVYKLSVDYC